jgi:hypothetical protein
LPGQPFAIPWVADQDSDFPSLQMTNKGDVISVGGILAAADPRGANVLDIQRADGTTMRYNGAVIYVTAQFNNRRKFDFWGHAPPEYFYDVNILPVEQYKVVYDQASKDGGREVRSLHGLMFIFQVTGHLHEFDFNFLLEVLTTAMVALASANYVTDLIMTYVMPKRTKYSLLKYQPSEDFSQLDAHTDAIMRRRGGSYHPINDKPHVHSHILHEHVAGSSVPEGKELLALLVRFEQRLNRLDAMDEANLGERTSETCDEFIDRLETGWVSGQQRQIQFSERGYRLRG